MFDFAEDLRDTPYTTFAAGGPRCARTGAYLRSMRGTLTPSMLMAVLRSHAASPGGYDPSRGLVGADVCMHAGFGPVRSAHTVGSLVCRVGDDGVHAWVTGTSTPCTSIFAPVWIEAGLPSALTPAPGRRPDDSLFWRHERLARAVQRDYRARHAVFAVERDALESTFVARSTAARPEERRAVSEACFAEADAARTRWIERVEEVPVRRRARAFDLAWRRFDRRAERS